jgi:protein TonB
MLQTPNLLDAPAPARPSAPPSLAGALVPSPLASASGPAVGAPAGAGRLFAGGDLLVAPGASGRAGGGGTAPRGSGQAPAGAASSQVVATGTGLTALARPLGGYQIRPEYPETARRDRAEGVAMLRFEVLATGRVGQVVVAQSAGHRDLDRAAIEAIKQWQFEPARRGATAVTVWVTLPVRFALSER